MNKLEEIKLKGLIEEKCESDEQAFIRGFNTVLILDLPVKFAEYLAKNGIKPDGLNSEGEITWMKFVGASHNNQGTTREKFQYWLTYIYKPE